MTTPVAIRDSRGPVSLGKLIGKGGEGAVYEIAGDSSRVAKIHHHPKPELGPKIAAMMPLKSDKLLTLAAWPLDVAFSTKGECIGLILPRVSGHKDIHELYSPRSRKTLFPSADWRFLVRAAANTARAFAAIHDIGCVIGDVNHGGVLVSDKATVRLIDCESFQFSTNGKHYLCEVGVPTFTPPELQGKPFRGVIRTPNHDNFGLAILIFHLLYMGRHPFAGRFLGRGDMSPEQAIAEFRFAYGAQRATYQMEPPPNVPALSIASPAVAQLFERAMAPGSTQPGARPTSREWVTALETLEKQLKPCHVNPSHYHFNGLDHCPWCHLEAATGAVLFNFVVKTGPQVAVGDITAVWAKIIAVPSPGPAPDIAQWNNLTASPEAKAHGSSRSAKAFFGHGGMVAAILVLLAVIPVAFIFIAIGAFVVWPQVARWAAAKESLQKFRDAEAAAESHWKALNDRWNNDATDHRFTTQLRQLQHEKDELQNLPNVRQRRYQELERNREKQQKKQFLESFQIDRAKIPGVGPSRKVMLESYNIETAWDVEEKRVLRVPGFGPALTREMVNWRRSVEAKFRFDPRKGIDPQEIAALDRDIDNTKRKLQNNLMNGPQALEQIRAHILAQRQVMKPQLDAAAKALAQARANVKAA